MTPRAAFWKWSILGGVTAILLVVGQAIALGGVAGLLQVGEDSEVRPLIESELGEIPLAPQSGHDGQIYYAIGLDLFGEETPGILDHGAYRYRRIIYPAVASLFGVLDGHALLTGMIVVTVASAAMASGLVAAFSVRFGVSDWLALVIVLNPGVWLAVRVLTADSLALASMLLGMYLFMWGRKGPTLAFALSALSKDVYLATPAGLAFSKDRTRWPLILIPAGLLIAWMAWLTLAMGDGFSGRGNLALPFMGILEASRVWPSVDVDELLYVLFAVVSVAGGLIYGVLVKSWLRWPILAWSIIGVVSSNWVWDLGNNAARVFAPIVVLVALAEARRVGGQRIASTEPSIKGSG